MAQYYKLPFSGVGPGVPSGIGAMGSHHDTHIRLDHFIIEEEVEEEMVRMLYVKFETAIPTEDERFTKILAVDYTGNDPR